MKKFPLPKLLPVLLCGIIFFTANAQKLPNVQQVSLRAPADLKIDGKTAEWNNQFQAYNTHTDFYYTMANDDKNLYVVIQATDPAIIRRIVNGGLTLTVNESGQKRNKDAMSITYPVFEKNNRFRPNLGRVSVAAAFSRISAASSMSGSGVTVIEDIRDDNTMNVRGTAAKSPPVNTDSLAIVNNNNMADKAKYIRVNGIKDVDSLISVYNADGIKAAASFDNKLAYTCELAIALKQLNLPVSSPVKFAYQLMINEVVVRGVTTYTYDQAGKMTGMRYVKTDVGMAGQLATDFWGEYTLAKK
jgi:hypothetical protein